MILLQIYYTKEGVKMKNKQINRTLSLLLSVVMVLSLCLSLIHILNTLSLFFYKNVGDLMGYNFT